MVKSIALFMLLGSAMLPAGLPPATAGASGDPPRGTVVEAVACAADPGQSYALYLPTAYSRERRWPVIYFFEPGARGTLPVRLFSAAAEKYGYILACSNNSRNGPWDPIAQAARAVWKDTRSRFAIDEARVYSAGHSGGAKAAMLLGVFLEKPWAGVISCCGGWPERMPGETLPGDLAVFVTAGLYDFNYWPSRDIASRLDALGVTNRLEIFPGGHAWMPAEVAMEALAWLELQAMKKGLRKKDDAWIASRFAAGLLRVGEIDEAKDPVAAHEACLALAADFRGLIDVAPAEAPAARLARRADLEKSAKERQAAEKEEYRMFGLATRALQGYLNAGSARERRRWLDELDLPGLRRKKSGGSAAGLSADRLQRYLFMDTANKAIQAYGQGDMKKARELYELAVLIDPGRGDAWYNLACANSRLGEIKTALRALETAALNGVRDPEAIAADPDLEAIRKEPAYIRLLASLKNDKAAEKP